MLPGDYDAFIENPTEWILNTFAAPHEEPLNPVLPQTFLNKRSCRHGYAAGHEPKGLGYLGC